MKKYRKHKTLKNCVARQPANYLKLHLQESDVEETLDSAGLDSKDMWKALKELWPLIAKNFIIHSINGKVNDAKMVTIMITSLPFAVYWAMCLEKLVMNDCS